MIIGSFKRTATFALTATVLAVSAPAFADRRFENETVYRPDATYLPGEGGCWNEHGNGIPRTPCGND